MALNMAYKYGIYVWHKSFSLCHTYILPQKAYFIGFFLKSRGQKQSALKRNGNPTTRAITEVRNGRKRKAK